MTWSSVLTAAGYLRGGDLLHVPTSGTSGGAPRVVLRTLASWTDSFAPFTAATGITAGDVVLAAGPPSSLFVYARAHAAYLGARLVASDRWDPRRLAEATVAHLTPAMLSDALEPEIAAAWQGRLRLAVVAGAALPSGLRERAADAGLDAVEYYGAAELSLVALGRGRLTPFDEVETQIRDGEIWVASPWTALGYAADASGPLRRDGRWCTVGDRGAVVDGALLVHGRAGAVLTGGTTVQTAEVEAVLRQVPGVADCAVLGLPHERLGAVVAAVVVGGRRADAVAACRQGLPRAARPVLWFQTDRLPRTGAGKPDLPALRGALADGEVARWV